MNDFALEYRVGFFVLDVLIHAGHSAYLVGGCVRDHILGRPCKDVDVCTSATPDQVGALFLKTKLVGAKFGVCLVEVDNTTIEVATFRKEGAYTDSRHPDLVTLATDIMVDLRRRDFTMNALLMDESGEVIDLFRSRGSLDARTIHSVGEPDDRFIEDPLRMLRAIRFACQLDFHIGSSTEAAILSNAPSIQNISKERVTQELVKILTSGQAAKGLTLLSHLGLLKFILPEVENLRAVPQNPKYHPEGNAFIHTLKLLEQLPAGCSLTLALAALLHDTGKLPTLAMKDGQPTFYGHELDSVLITHAVLTRMRFSNDTCRAVERLVAQHMRFRNANVMRRGKLLAFVGQADFPEMLQLHRLDALAGSGNLDHWNFCAKTLLEAPPELLNHPPTLINGDDLIARGMKSGPGFRSFLNIVRDAQFEGTISNREEALALLETHMEYAHG